MLNFNTWQQFQQFLCQSNYKWIFPNWFHYHSNQKDKTGFQPTLPFCYHVYHINTLNNKDEFIRHEYGLKFPSVPVMMVSGFPWAGVTRVDLQVSADRPLSASTCLSADESLQGPCVRLLALFWLGSEGGVCIRFTVLICCGLLLEIWELNSGSDGKRSRQATDKQTHEVEKAF